MPNSNDFNHFDYNPVDIGINRSLFNMDHSVKFSCNVGECIPFEVIECLPGDSWTVDTSRVIRLQPLVTPIMDEVIQDVYYFFCPNRLVWNHWKQFCGENTSGPWAPSTSYDIPTIGVPEGGFDVGTIADYMGIPPKSSENLVVNALPFRAYALICDQWFRSEAVMNPVNVSVGDTDIIGSNGSDQVTDIQKGGKPFIACKFFDYFTSALPSPQRGNAANVFPDESYADVVSLGKSFMEDKGIVHRFSSGNSSYAKLYDNYNISQYANPHMNYTTTSNTWANPTTKKDIFHNASGLITGLDSSTADTSSVVYAFDNLFARLDSASFNINDLRTAFAVQRYLEKSARYGGRYIEFVKGFFGVDSPDARLQRTEYLGGSRLSLNINSVEQTSATQSGSTPQGNVAGMSVTADMNSDFTYSCTEHGYIIGISVLRYHHSYQQGVNRMWLRSQFTDFYLPTFAFLGEQEIKNAELYASDNADNSYSGNQVFGYQERWAEYRYMPNRIAGQFRSVASTSLDMWHLGDNYSSLPTLSPEWIREDKGMLDRCLAVTSDVADQCLCDFYIKCKAARPLPLYSIPGMIDHY